MVTKAGRCQKRWNILTGGLELAVSLGYHINKRVSLSFDDPDDDDYGADINASKTVCSIKTMAFLTIYVDM